MWPSMLKDMERLKIIEDKRCSLLECFDPFPIQLSVPKGGVSQVSNRPIPILQSGDYVVPGHGASPIDSDTGHADLRILQAREEVEEVDEVTAFGYHPASSHLWVLHPSGSRNEVSVHPVVYEHRSIQGVKTFLHELGERRVPSVEPYDNPRPSLRLDLLDLVEFQA